jgi:nicotinate-nucleotide adenylyltransferase
MKQDKIGLLGGTFNPAHRGHVELGLKVMEAFGLDKVLYVLSAQPPHKKLQALAPAPVRLAMLTEALRPYPGLEPCDLELRRPGHSWTIDTVRQLRAAAPMARFFFITGSEGFLKIRTWKAYRQLFCEVFFIIVIRQKSHQAKVALLLRDEAVPFAPGAVDLPQPPGAALYAYASDLLALSATAIRKGTALRQDISPWVDQHVKTIMEENKLYED